MFQHYFQEAFFNPKNGGEGYIAWRLRTIIRNKPGISHKRTTKEKLDLDTKKKKIYSENISIELTENIKEMLHFLKNAGPNDIEEIQQKMKLTLEYRQSRPQEEIIINCPRLLDTPGLVNIFLHRFTITKKD